ncbi:helix-turn-helix transcriptional regulator [Fulvivirga sp. 29W222]|uniref:Helix-turn-helix transcriptional regulator n=1 Tax=Fulvivirga marina TaxID=2494733 RepID=A0A937KCE3_9BACT|nr:AraC family transcriptional regulator [Fulvivirga marina]MBL6448066.1 helix-turn-helix transcriptional regulator [Fulvivirga marina]
MKHIKFNKTICGVDFLLNVLEFNNDKSSGLFSEVQSTDFFQIIFIKEASGRLQLNQSEINVSDNSIIFISQFQQYQWKIDKGSSFRAHVLVFQEDFLNEFFADKYFSYRLLYFYQTQYPLHIAVDEAERKAYLEQLLKIKEELVCPKSDSAHLIRSLVYYMLISLNRAYAEKYNVETAINQDNVAYEFRKLVEENICSKQRIEDYTALMGVSRITLNKLVKAQFNVTASDFIKSRLLFEVKMKLIYTQLTIAQIAAELNFSEPNHLSRLFKSREGVTPIEFREGYQNGM